MLSFALTFIQAKNLRNYNFIKALVVPGSRWDLYQWDTSVDV